MNYCPDCGKDNRHLTSVQLMYAVLIGFKLLLSATIRGITAVEENKKIQV